MRVLTQSEIDELLAKMLNPNKEEKTEETEEKPVITDKDKPMAIGARA